MSHDNDAGGRVADVARRMAARSRGLHSKLADAIGNPDEVRCRQCGKVQPVDATECLHSGWPKCCGYTMTIDPAPPDSESSPQKSTPDRTQPAEG